MLLKQAQICYLLCSLAVLCLIYPTDSARRVDVHKRMSEMMEYYKSPVGKRTLGIQHPEPDKLLGLGHGEDLEAVESAETSHGTSKTKFVETYKGVRVFGEGVVIERQKDGDYTGNAQGNLVEDIEEDLESIEPTLSVEEALKIALSESGDEDKSIDFDAETDASLMIYVVDNGEGNVDIKLTYEITYDVEFEGNLGRHTFIIDANSGRIEDAWSSLMTYEVTEVGHGVPFEMPAVGGNERLQLLYGQELENLRISKIDGQCYFENDLIRVINADEQGWGQNVTNDTYSVECRDGLMDGANGGYSPVADALYFSESVYRMYLEWYDTEPLPKSTTKLTARVHFGKNFANAFWDHKITTYGDGNNETFPFVTMDVVGHEIGHGFTEQHSNLIYDQQFGGINEAFSDMSGEATQYFILDENVDFQMGEMVFRNGKPLRYMDNPTKDNSSIDNADDFYSGMDPHYSSGVFNKVFYTLCNSEGWNIRSAFHVFLHANKLYWRENSDFNDAACGVLSAAGDLGYDEKQIESIFRSVAVHPCGKTMKITNDEVLFTITDLSASAGESLYFEWHVPESARNITIITDGALDDGDVDLIVKTCHKQCDLGRKECDEDATHSNSDCNSVCTNTYMSTNMDNSDNVSFAETNGDVIVIQLRSVTTFSKVLLHGVYDASASFETLVPYENSTTSVKKSTCKPKPEPEFRIWQMVLQPPENVSLIILQMSADVESWYDYAMFVKYNQPMVYTETEYYVKVDADFDTPWRQNSIRIKNPMEGKYYVLLVEPYAKPHADVIFGYSYPILPSVAWE